MKSLLAASLLLVIQGIPPLVGPLIPDSNGTVTGVVRRADTGQPIPDVLVAVVGASESVEKAMSNAVSTDRNGRFTIRNVTPANYTVAVQRDGFFSAIQAGPAVTTVEGQVSDIGAIDLIPGAAISGRIAGPDGMPLASALVQVMQASYVSGRMRFTPVKSTLTDDLGEYRLFWLPPGAYYVRGQYRTTNAQRPERYERLFFPGIAEEDAAPSILIGPGSEISGIDIRVPTTPVRGFTLSGRVTVASEDTPDRRVTTVYVIPRDRRVQLEDDADVFPNRAADPLNGRFEIRNVPPGAYDLFLVTRDGSGKVRTAHTTIDVEGRDIENIGVTLDPLVSLSGRITWDGGVPGDRLSKDSILIRPSDASLLILREDAEVDLNPETGVFVVALPQGRYVVEPAPALFPSTAYIADVKRGETSVFDSGLLVPSDAEALVVEIRTKGGNVSGTVMDPTRLRPSAYATVALVPELVRRKNLALYRNVKAGADGVFKFTNIAPGNYKLFAWKSVPTGAWENAAFLERFEDRGSPVVVEAGVETTLQTNVIP